MEAEIYLRELGPVAQANASGTQGSWYRTYTRLEVIPSTWYLPVFFLDEMHLITLSALIPYLVSLFARKKKKKAPILRERNALGYLSLCGIVKMTFSKQLHPENGSCNGLEERREAPF